MGTTHAIYIGEVHLKCFPITHCTESDAAFCLYFIFLSDFDRRRSVTYHSLNASAQYVMMLASIPSKPSKTCFHKTFPATASEFYVNICHWSCYIINVNIQNIMRQVLHWQK